MKQLSLLICLVLGVSGTALAQGNAEEGQKKSVACGACHGADGNRGGDTARGVTACIACHGPHGDGTSLSGFPDISGQHAAYLKSQLELFRSGDRNNSLNGMMGDIAKRLTDKDIDILSKYIAGLY